MAEYKYPLTNEWRDARERLSLLETLRDPWTIRNFEKIGVRGGWRCLELAGGGGSIAQWLCRQVGSEGHVVATDLEPRFLETIDAPNLEVWRHDLLRDPLPEAAFDLVHARSVLGFLPRPAETITKIVATVKPGGWLLLEEPDYVSEVPDPSMTPEAMALSKKAHSALHTLAHSLGYDAGFGRRLYYEVSRNGISDIQAEGSVSMRIGGTPSASFFKVTSKQLQDQVLNAGLLTPAELEDFQSLLDSPEYRWVGQMAISVWGRRISAK
jgi:2-polyprenyl-3-methyl-5-hydroxy-6-metoxy-1,4-benzoquinol methylase